MKDIKDFNGLYQIDKTGNVLSLARWTTACKGYMKKEFIMRSSPDKDGYLKVVLRKDNKSFTRKVHRLVAETFIPNPLNLPYVNHKNGLKYDNNVDNLEWSTAKENVNHADNTGLRNIRGENQYNHKLTEAQVLEIRSLAKSMRGASIAKLYGVTKECIYLIINRHNWKHVTQSE